MNCAPLAKGRERHPYLSRQGVIDLLFFNDGKWFLVDYKTDNCSAKEAVEKYSLQMKLYAEAITAIYHIDLAEIYLYLFHTGEIAPIKF